MLAPTFLPVALMIRIYFTLALDVDVPGAGIVEKSIVLSITIPRQGNA